MRKLLLALALFAASALYAADWQISPTGVTTNKATCTYGSGTFCSIAYMMQAGASAGETIWFKGGTYQIPQDAFGFTCFRRTGTIGNPVTFRGMPGERATLTDSTHNGDSPTVTPCGADQVYRDLEVTSSDNANRVCNATGSQCSNANLINYGEGIKVRQGSDTTVLPYRLKIINCIVHDTKQGISWWAEAINSEVTGCLLYYNGWSATDRGHGHGQYCQGQPTGDFRLSRQNLLFRNGNHGCQHFGSSGTGSQNFTRTDDFFWGNADIPEVGGGGRNLFIGGTDVVKNYTMTGTTLYNSGFTIGQSNWPVGSVIDSTMTGNLIYEGTVGFVQMLAPGGFGTGAFGGAAALANKIIYDGLSGFTTGNYPNNTYSTPRSAYAGATDIKYNLNPYDANRCDVRILNPSLASTVSINLATVCGWANGDSIQVRYAEDYYGTAVNTVLGAPVTYAMPMTTATWTASDPAGNWSAGTTYLPKFGVWVIYRTAAASTPTPTSTPTFTPTASPTPTLTPTNTPTSTPTITPPGPTATPTPTATNTPTPTPTSTPVPGGCTYLYASAATLAGPMTLGSDGLAFGGQYITSSEDGRNGPTLGGTATFTFSLPNGTYYLNHRVIGLNDISDSLFFSRDGESDLTHITDVTEQTWSPLWQWTRMTDRAIGGPAANNPAQYQQTIVIADSPANHTIRIRGREIGTKLNMIAACPSSALASDPTVPTATPTNTPPGPTATPTRTPTPTFTPGGPTPTFTPTSIRGCWHYCPGFRWRDARCKVRIPCPLP